MSFKLENIPTIVISGSKWINIEDKLPNDSGFVLVTNGKWISVAYFEDIDVAEHEIFDVLVKAKDYLYENLEEIRGNVTHWMPLPEPPKENE